MHNPKSLDDYPVGTPLRVTFDGTVEERFLSSTMGGLRTARVFRLGDHITEIAAPYVIHAAEVTRRAPTWKPGDVVVVRWNGPTSLPYTYVRGMHAWPGERARAKTDAEITALYAEGKVEHVLRDGKPVESASVAAPNLTTAPRTVDRDGRLITVGAEVRFRPTLDRSLAGSLAGSSARGTVERVEGESVVLVGQNSGATYTRAANHIVVVSPF